MVGEGWSFAYGEARLKRLDLTDLRPEDIARTRFGADDCGAANAARRIYQPFYRGEVDC